MRTSLDVGNGDIVTVCEWLLRSKKGRRKASLATTGNLDFENVTKQVFYHFFVDYFLSFQIHCSKLQGKTSKLFNFEIR